MALFVKLSFIDGIFFLWVQVILFEIDWAISHTNLHELFCFISWTNWVNSAKFMDNFWILCHFVSCGLCIPFQKSQPQQPIILQKIAQHPMHVFMENIYDDLIIINLYVDSWSKILLFRTHHLWNSPTELILNGTYLDAVQTRIDFSQGFWVNAK